MKVAIFGGTGKTGQHLIQQALEAGHEVNALARTPSKLGMRHPNLQLIQGDILNATDVNSVIQGCDAIVSVLGPSNNKPEFIISRGMDNILNAMKKNGIHRIIISAGAGVREPEDKPKVIDYFFGFLLKIISRNVVADMQQTVDKLKSSDLNWTIVRVPMLTDEAAQGKLNIGYVGDINPRITRADMAAFMLKQLSDTKFLRKSPAISN